MIEFAKQISEKWNIPASLAEKICVAYTRKDTPFYLVEYVPEIAIEMSAAAVWEIYDFLSSMEELLSKKKKVLTALKKSDADHGALEKRVTMTYSSYELDDILLPLRPNPRSKGQLAVKKGLEPLASQILKQTDEQCTVQDLAEPYVGKDASLKTVDDVIAGVKDLLAEKFAYDETVRAMTREFAFDDGFFELTPKNKKDSQFAQYIGKNIDISDCTKEELLKFMVAEDNKTIRLKLNVQLFRITELIRHHFIENPDACGFDLICETIDECWLRLLQPIVERDVKEMLRKDAEMWVSKQIASEIWRKIESERNAGPVFIIDAANEKNIIIIALNGTGELLGVTTERKPPEGKNFTSDRLRQFVNRHRPGAIHIVKNDQASLAEAMLKQVIDMLNPVPVIAQFEPDISKVNPSDSEWMKKNFETLLDEDMRRLYGYAIVHLKPIALLQKIGNQYYDVHGFQQLLPEAKFLEIINRLYSELTLKNGISIKDLSDSPIVNFLLVTPEIVQAIRSFDAQTPLVTKNDLLKVPEMTEAIFRNISGFLLIPNAEELIDRTAVHPDHFPLIYEISEQLTVSIDTIVDNPDVIRSYMTEEPMVKVFIEKNLFGQVSAGRKYLSQQAPKLRKKLKLNEIKEGAIVSGRVTNITQFGVFVNINAVCDGLIHISQLADEYVETPDQVVGINDKVDVKILKVDVKKRRISLSMKNLGNKAPKVRPSQGQLDHLADFFKNR